MDDIIQYLYNSIQPVDETEMIILDNFNEDKFNSMKQDGIMIIRKNDTSGISTTIDWVVINNYILLRKNKPNQLEWLNSDGSFSFDLSRIPIYRRLIPPPWETVDHPFIIASIIKETNGKNKNYIEYGVRTGECIEVVSKEVNIAYGVDILPYNNINTNIQMFCSYTDDYSINKLPYIEYDYALIDADHSSKQVLIDFEYIYKYLKSGGYIFLHDTYPCFIENLKPSACHDCYLSPIIIKQRYPQIEILTLPLNPGLTIIRKK
jgi:hypothetical protein